MSKINKVTFDEWMDALESGDYKQGKTYLNNNGQFCCLGVLADLIIKKNPDDWEWVLDGRKKLGNKQTGSMHNNLPPMKLDNYTDFHMNFDASSNYSPKYYDEDGNLQSIYDLNDIYTTKSFTPVIAALKKEHARILADE